MLTQLTSQQIELWSIERLVEYPRNPRKNDAAVDRMCASIREFGFKIPCLVRSDGEIVDLQQVPGVQSEPESRPGIHGPPARQGARKGIGEEVSRTASMSLLLTLILVLDLAHDREHELTRDSMLALAQQWMRKLGDGMDPSGL